MTFATYEEAIEWLDDAAADDPLHALREFPEHLSAYRIDCCAAAEPLAALVHAAELLTPERRAACQQAVNRDGGVLHHYVPDRLKSERLTAIRAVLNRTLAPEPQIEPEPPRTRQAPQERRSWTIACEVCGDRFAAIRADARFCSPACRQKAARARRQGAPEGAEQGGRYLRPGSSVTRRAGSAGEVGP